MVYRAGFAESRRQARQLVRHRHFEVNGRVVDIPSYRVRVGDEIRVREKSKNLQPIEAAITASAKTPPRWLDVDYENRVIRVVDLPKREDITDVPVDEQVVIEFYSR